MKKVLSIISIVFVAGVIYYLSQNKGNIQILTLSPTPTPSPATSATENKDLQKHTFDEVGLTFSVPKDLTVSGEMVDESFILTIQRSSYPNTDYYQLYAIYQFSDTSQVKPNELKADLEEQTMQETEIDGNYAISGQYKTERNRYVTKIVTNKGIMTVTTSQPTEKNLQLTKKILQTFDFN